MRVLQTASPAVRTAQREWVAEPGSTPSCRSSSSRSSLLMPGAFSFAGSFAWCCGLLRGMEVGKAVQYRNQLSWVPRLFVCFQISRGSIVRSSAKETPLKHPKHYWNAVKKYVE